MSFSDLPIVDESAKSSAESLTVVKSFFSQKNGFISREEYPDYGTDLNVELIKHNNSSSAKNFLSKLKALKRFDLF